MHMKYDYYNHTNVFKPGYNVQMGSSNGYIRHIYVSGDANDRNTYIPFMEGYHRAYGCFPRKTPADARYEQVVLMRSKIGIFSLSYKKQSVADWQK